MRSFDNWTPFSSINYLTKNSIYTQLVILGLGILECVKTKTQLYFLCYTRIFWDWDLAYFFPMSRNICKAVFPNTGELLYVNIPRK